MLMPYPHPRALSCLLPMVLVVGIFVLAPGKGSAIEPDSSEVKQMVERALKWMENQDDERLGGRCLIGLSYYKAGRPLTHPKVVAAKNACESSIAIDVKQLDNYSVGLALVFLLETDPDRNRSLARRYVDELLRRQQRAGGWGYPETPTGDTSQTQYPTLGLWLAINNGIDVPVNVVERVCNWLLRTQDPSGAWGYQGVDPGHYRRVNQAEVRPALAAAGLGSLFICADILAANEIKAPAERTGTGMPSALKPVGDPLETKSRPSGITVDSKLIRQALNDGNYW